MGEADKQFTPWRFFGFGSGFKVPGLPKTVFSAKKSIAKLSLSNHEMAWVMNQILKSLEDGLQPETREESSIKPLPTYVTELPSGEESGQYLAVDVGGTNMRAMIVTIEKGEIRQETKAEKIPVKLQNGSGAELFNFIAATVDGLLAKHRLKGKAAGLQLGLTFSFPVNQTSLSHGSLLRWTKGFRCDDVVGEDVSDLLNAAFARRKLDLRVGALLNDSTGCLVSGSFANHKVSIGVIVGTGCNACYTEKCRNIAFLEKEEKRGKALMVMNTEWGTFGSNGELESLKTKWDREVDLASPNQGKQAFEKLISGMYLGELVRSILKNLAANKLVFSQVENLDRLEQVGSFPASFVCQAEADPMGTFTKCRAAIRSVLGTNNSQITDEDCIVVRMTCEQVVRRACMLLAAGLAALIKKMGTKDVVIAADGMLFRSHPMFYLITKEKLMKLLGSDITFDIESSEDGSGIGAALLVASKKDNK